MDKHIFIKNIILRGVIITLIGSFISMHGMEEKATKKTDSVAYTNDELVQEVIRRNNGDPKKALMFAVNNNLSGMTRSLLALKVDPNVKDYSDHRIDHVFPSGETEFVTPLISAVHNNNAEMVKILLDTNACVTNDCFNNNSVLTYASFWGRKNIVQLLLAAKADVDFQEPILKQNSLQIASSNGHAPLVALFLKSPHKQLELAKFNALTAALSFGRQSCARLLLENKASFNTADWSTVDGCTKIFILQRYKNECIGIVREVLDGSYRSQKNELMNNLPVRVINQYKDQAIMPSESIELINEYANLYGKDAKRATLKQAIVVAKQLVGNSNGFFDNGIDDSSHNGVCVGDMLVPQKKVRDKDLCIIA